MKQLGYRLDAFGNTELSLNVHFIGSDLTAKDIERYANKIRKSLTVNGNPCDVQVEDGLIVISGNVEGNMRCFLALAYEMCTRGCWFESDKYVDTAGNAEQHELTGAEWDCLARATF